MEYVYYLYSDKIKKYYIGKTNNLELRLSEHNAGKGQYTRIGIPWRLIGYIECNNNSEATQLETRLKKAKNKKYIKWHIKQNGILLE